MPAGVRSFTGLRCCARVGLHLPSELAAVKEILRPSQQVGLKLGEDRQAANDFKKCLHHRVRNAEKHPVHVVEFPTNLFKGPEKPLQVRREEALKQHIGCIAALENMPRLSY